MKNVIRYAMCTIFLLGLLNIAAAQTSKEPLAHGVRKQTAQQAAANYSDIVGNWFVPANWQGVANAGVVANTGNTRNTNLNGKLNLTYKRDNWSHTLDTEAQLDQSRGVRTAERYFTSFESNYSFAKKSFSFIRGSYLRDRFSPYAYTVLTTVGYGCNIFKTDTMALGVQAGPGFRRLEEAGSGDIDNHWIVYLSSNYVWQITKASSFTERLTSELGHPNNTLTSKTAINTKIIGNLGMQVAFNANYNSLIPDGSVNTVKLDTTTTASLVYSF